MKSLFARFAKDESGATAIEYGLLATLIGIAIIAGASALGIAVERPRSRRSPPSFPATPRSLGQVRKLPRGFRAARSTPYPMWRGSVRHLVARFVRDRSAATAIEYGLIAMLICLAIIAGATVVGSQIGSMLQGVAGKIITPD